MDIERHGKTEGTGDWEEVIAPIDCSYYAISDKDGPEWWKCSEPNDPDSCRHYPAGDSFVVTAPHVGAGSRWNQNAHVTWVKSSMPLDLYFLK